MSEEWAARSRELLKERDENVVISHPSLIRAFGCDRDLAAFFEQLLYWQDKAEDPNGWIYKTQKDWYSEVFLTPYQLRRSTAKLIDMGLLETERHKVGTGTPLFYRLKQTECQSFIAAGLESKETSHSGTKATAGTTPDKRILKVKKLEHQETRTSRNFTSESEETSLSSIQSPHAEPTEENPPVRDPAPLAVFTGPADTEPQYPPLSKARIGELSPWFVAICEACSLDRQRIGGAKRAEVFETANVFAFLGDTPEDIGNFRAWFELSKPSMGAPHVTQLRSLWSQFRAWQSNPKSVPSAVGGRPTERETQADRNRRAVAEASDPNRVSPVSQAFDAIKLIRTDR